MWLEDEDNNPAPHLNESDQLSKAACEAFVDTIVKGQKDLENEDDNNKKSELQGLVSSLQHHSHTFTCYKKKRVVTIPANCGHGSQDGQKTGPSLKVPVCRFMFPRHPVRNTCIVEPPNDSIHSDTIEEWKKIQCRIRYFLLRQTFQQHPGQMTEERTRFFNLTFDELLYELGLTESQYMNGLRLMVRSKGPQVFVKRSCADVFINNYNPKLLLLHRANIDVSYVINEYAVAAYILGYLTKGEMGMSKLLKTLDEEAQKFGLSTDEKLKRFSRALDNIREVSIQEICYRTLGLGMCVGSRIVKFINVNKPELRDGLLKGNLDNIEENESPFMNSIIDYYQARPEELEGLSLAEYVANYDIVYSKSSNTEVISEVADDDNIEDIGQPDNTNIMPLQSGMGFIRKRSFEAVIRYHLDKKNDEEMRRNMLLLFLPFRNEDAEIHCHKTLSIDDLFSVNFTHIEEQRQKFEPHREMLVSITECLQEDNESFCEDEIPEDENFKEQENTKIEDIKDFVEKVKKNPRLRMFWNSEVHESIIRGERQSSEIEL